MVKQAIMIMFVNKSVKVVKESCWTLIYPVIFGVLTTENEDQAWDRLGGKHGHKGRDAAIALYDVFNKAINYVVNYISVI